mmetsp:Transcript_13542/g.31984  ORF Transcript_13542/g.31984 Transcript_13542/m.31984 type:complete len:240 (-) Transcript_13542:28-747(-)
MLPRSQLTTVRVSMAPSPSISSRLSSSDSTSKPGALPKEGDLRHACSRSLVVAHIRNCPLARNWPSIARCMSAGTVCAALSAAAACKTFGTFPRFMTFACARACSTCALCTSLPIFISFAIFSLVSLDSVESSSRSLTLRRVSTREPVSWRSRVRRDISALPFIRRSCVYQAPPTPSTSTTATKPIQRPAPLRTSRALSLPSAPILTVETPPISIEVGVGGISRTGASVLEASVLAQPW